MWSLPQQNSPIVQPVEHLTVNQGVVGSSPTRGATWPVGQAVKTPPFHGGIGGSIPPPVTIRALSSAGRASALQAECQRFDPVSAHHEINSFRMKAVFLFAKLKSYVLFCTKIKMPRLCRLRFSPGIFYQVLLFQFNAFADGYNKYLSAAVCFYLSLIGFGVLGNQRPGVVMNGDNVFCF